CRPDFASRRACRSCQIRSLINPDGRVLDGQDGTGLWAFIMAGQNRNRFWCDLSGFRINDVTAGGKRHALDAQIAIFAPLGGKPNTGGSSAADKLDRSFGRQHVQTITYDCLSAETSRVLESF